MRVQIFSFYDRLVLQRPLLALILSFLVIGGLSFYIPGFKLDASSDSLVLEGDKDLQYYRQIAKRYDSEDFLLVTYHPREALMADETLQQLDQLRAELAGLSGVSSVVSILDLPLLQSPQVSLDDIASGEPLRTLRSPNVDRDLVLQELTDSPIYHDLLTSADGRTTALQVNLVRDQRYISLLERREQLREKKKLPGWTADEERDLQAAEQAFRDYATEAKEQQGLLVERVRGILDGYRDNASIFLGGVPMIAADMITYIKSDLVIFGAGILVFVIVMLAVIFRSLLWVLLPLGTCVLSVLFMLGLITALDWRMTVISSNFVAILLIITLSITIHLVVRYRELVIAEPELSQAELVRKTMVTMVKPCIYTTVTTIVAFASLVISGIRPVIDFGWMMTIGVTAALVIVFLIFPSVLMLTRKVAVNILENTRIPTTVRFAAVTEHYGRWILLGGVLLTVLSAIGISQLKVENRFIDYFHEDTEIYRGMQVIDAKLGGTIPLEIIIDSDTESLAGFEKKPVQGSSQSAAEFDQAFGDDDFADDFAPVEDFADDFGEQESAASNVWFNRAGLERIESVHDYIDSLDETGKVMSLATLYKTLKLLTSGLDDIQLTLIYNKMPESIRKILVDPFTDAEAGQARITVRVMETSRTLQRDQLLHQIHDHLVNDMGFADSQVHLTGMLVLYNNMLQSLYRSQVLTLGAVFLAITATFWLLFRSLWLALIAVAPNILAACVVLGGMGLAGVPLDIMTVTIAAIVVGIGVDDTIHYVHRFIAEFPKDRNYVATMYRCHGSIGKAMYYTSVTIIFGFSILALSNFNPSIYFGLLTGTAMFAALMGALLLLPQLLIVFKPLGAEMQPDLPVVEPCNAG